MKPPIARPDASFTREYRDKLAKYVADMWRRVDGARSEQVENYNNWNKNYQAIPAEAVRNVPWYKSSNFVVPLIRIFIDTFVARTLNIVFSTRPLFTSDSFPREQREAVELYLNRKAIYEWEMYTLFRDLLTRGNKNGTAIVKTIHTTDEGIWVKPDGLGGISQEIPIVTYDGPRNYIIPFEDVAFYPTTANSLRECEIIFQRVRFTEEGAKRARETEQWDMTEEELVSCFKAPTDTKRVDEAANAGVVDGEYREFHAIEAHLRWDMSGKLCNIVVLLCPDNPERVLDLYFNPYPDNWPIFQDYRPFPREDFIWGSSMAEILQMGQEEASQIHNDRRNNSFLANAPIFKKRSNSSLPNPSTNWYPGKVFEVDDMMDFDVVTIGRNYSDTLSEEQFDISLMERLSGIGAVAQGYAQGMMGKRGIYNATGTLAILSESNQRQDTNIRDAREVLGAVGKTNFFFQSTFGKDDPMIEALPASAQEQLRAAMGWAAKPGNMRRARLEVKMSNAGSNSEVARQNLMQLAGVMNNYAGAVQQLTMQQLDPNLNQALRTLINETLTMMKWIATRMLRAWDEYDAEGVLPDARAALEQQVNPGAGGPAAPAGPGAGVPGMVAGGAGSPVPATSREGLEAILSLPPAIG